MRSAILPTWSFVGKRFRSKLLRTFNATIKREPGSREWRCRGAFVGKLNWRSPNGKLKEMSCRVVLLKLDRRGVIELPPLTQRVASSKDKKFCEPIPTLSRLSVVLKNWAGWSWLE